MKKMRINGIWLGAFLTMMSAAAYAQTPTAIDERWGDQGDGTFANPVLNADYSDPDVIRVGNKYYMTCSEFHYMGMPILESTDLVNWKIIARVYDHINIEGYDAMRRYGEGTWAPAIRYHDGKFWIFVCTPKDGLFMTTAEKPEGPWKPLTCVKQVKGWEDPCPLWDDDGQAYIGRSQLGAGPIILHKMSPDGKTLLDEGVKIYEGPVAEGTKFFKKDGYYYLSIPEGGVGTGWQMVLRSKHIYGPYEGKRTLEQGSTAVNGPHQGALVDTPQGEWWFYHFQSTEPLGRVVHLQPVTWKDGFPTMGADYDGNGVGEPMKICKKPRVKKAKAHLPQTSDTFSSRQLQPQWQWNHNPDEALWSLTSHPGYLALHPSVATRIREARGQLTQKAMGYRSVATAQLDMTLLGEGQRSGIASLGRKMHGMGVVMRASGDTAKPYLYHEMDGTVQIGEALADGITKIWLRLEMNAVDNALRFLFSTDGKNYTQVGETFSQHSGDWKGMRVGLYTYADRQMDGTALFDSFEYITDGPKTN